MDEALQSIARAFARNREAMPLLELGIFVLLAITVALQLGGLARRWLRAGIAARLFRGARTQGTSAPCGHLG